MPIPFGFLLAVPVLGYSSLLLFRLMGMSEDLSPRDKRSMYFAVFANLSAWGLAVFMLMRFRLD